MNLLIDMGKNSRLNVILILL